MKTYTIERAKLPLPQLSDRVFDPAREPFCAAHPFAAIDCYPWDEGGYRPEARAWMVALEGGLGVLLCANEPTIRADAKRWNGDVWLDSCLECFIRPRVDDARYLNIEANAGGAALIGIGEGRGGRSRLPAMPADFQLQVSRHAGGWWAVRYELTYALIRELFGAVPQAGDALFGNFYCCDESIHPHFGAWSPIAAAQPDFHRPECFGSLRLS